MFLSCVRGPYSTLLTVGCWARIISGNGAVSDSQTEHDEQFHMDDHNYGRAVGVQC